MACPCTPLSIAAICCAGSASPSPTHCAATKHLTRSRAVSRIPGRYSCRFSHCLSVRVRDHAFMQTGRGLCLKTASRVPGYIRRPVAPCPPRTRRYRLRWQGQCESTHATDCSLCGRRACSAEMPVIMRPAVGGSPSGISPSTARIHDVSEVSDGESSDRRHGVPGKAERSADIRAARAA